MLKKKLPSFLFNKNIEIKGHKSIDEDGNAIYETYIGKCMATTQSKRVFTNDKVTYVDETKLIINDELGFDCYGGKALLEDKTLNIVSTTKDDGYTVILCV